jgi:hypothetical protein
MRRKAASITAFVVIVVLLGVGIGQISRHGEGFYNVQLQNFRSDAVVVDAGQLYGIASDSDTRFRAYYIQFTTAAGANCIALFTVVTRQINGPGGLDCNW